MEAGMRLEHVRESRYELVQVYAFLELCAFLDCVPDVANDATGSVRLGFDINQDFTKCGSIGCPLINEALPCAGIVGNPCKRLTQLMGYGCSHFAEQTDSAQATNFLAALSGLPLRQPARGNIDHRSQNKKAFLCLNWVEPDLNRKFGTVFSTGK